MCIIPYHYFDIFIVTNRQILANRIILKKKYIIKYSKSGFKVLKIKNLYPYAKINQF